MLELFLRSQHNALRLTILDIIIIMLGIKGFTINYPSEINK